MPSPMIAPPFGTRSRFAPRELATHALVLVLGNLMVGVLLRVLGFGGSLGVNVLYSQCIGLSIYGLASGAFAITRRASGLRLALILLAILLGGLLGQMAANLMLRARPRFSSDFLKAEFVGLFFGCLGSIVMFLRERYWDLQQELQARELLRVEAEKRSAEADKRSVEAQLKLLQAQIEPHFLFNTLANLAGLIPADPALASHLLEVLNRYLRASLRRTRAEGGTLGDELDLLEAYLEVFRIRLGERLTYQIAATPALRALPFPPMLLQPLVENAIRHGIEPCIQGGSIRIAAAREAGALRLTVRDTGAGLGDIPGSGFGLDNVRARLAALFGPAGSMEVAEPPEGGVLATLSLPA